MGRYHPTAYHSECLLLEMHPRSFCHNTSSRPSLDDCVKPDLEARDENKGKEQSTLAARIFLPSIVGTPWA